MKTSISFVLLFFTSVAAADAGGQTALEQALAGEMVSIPGGSFYMGDLTLGRESDTDEHLVHRETRWRSAGLTSAVWRDSGEKPFHLHHERVVKVHRIRNDYNMPVRRVTVAAFRLGKYEVTFAQWDACVAAGGCNGYSPHDGDWGRGDRPVINVSWHDVQSFIYWLNSKTGRGFRLPTEAEWEYAARADGTTKYNRGNDIALANCQNIHCGDSWEFTAPVGSFQANAWGLHDMHGNVWEWVQDCWNDSYEGAPTDGSAWTSGDCGRRVIRGDSWNSYARHLRTAIRYGTSRTNRYNVIGFRLAQDE